MGQIYQPGYATYDAGGVVGTPASVGDANSGYEMAGHYSDSNPSPSWSYSRYNVPAPYGNNDAAFGRRVGIN